MRKALAILPFLIPGIVSAQTPTQDAQALVAKYLPIIRNYAAMLKESADHKTRLPLDVFPESLSVMIARESRPEVRQVLLMARCFMFEALPVAYDQLPEDAADYTSHIRTSSLVELSGQITPASPALDLVAALHPDLMSYFAWHHSGGGYVAQSSNEAATKALAFCDEIFAQHPNRQVRVMALACKLDLNSGPRDLEAMKVGLARLVAFEPQAPEVAKWKTWLEQAYLEDKAAPKVGGVLPNFQVEDLDHPGITLAPASFKGKYWILDFWATWCGPCKGELPFVHKAYAKYHPAGLEILSISSDKKAEEIAAFRRNPEHPMPWHHALPLGKVRDNLMTLFQVRGIPHVLLVGPDGRILAQDEDLRGKALEATLGQYLGAK